MVRRLKRKSSWNYFSWPRNGTLKNSSNPQPQGIGIPYEDEARALIFSVAAIKKLGFSQVPWASGLRKDYAQPGRHMPCLGGSPSSAPADPGPVELSSVTGLMIRAMSPRARLPGLKVWLCHSLAMKSWASYWIFLCLRFHACKMGMIIDPVYHTVVGVKLIHTC